MIHLREYWNTKSHPHISILPQENWFFKSINIEGLQKNTNPIDEIKYNAEPPSFSIPIFHSACAQDWWLNSSSRNLYKNMMKSSENFLYGS